MAFHERHPSPAGACQATETCWAPSVIVRVSPARLHALLGEHMTVTKGMTPEVSSGGAMLVLPSLSLGAAHPPISSGVLARVRGLIDRASPPVAFARAGGVAGGVGRVDVGLGVGIADIDGEAGGDSTALGSDTPGDADATAAPPVASSTGGVLSG